MNGILLRRKCKVIVPAREGFCEPRYVLTIMKNIESIGFTFSEELYNELLCLSKETLFSFYKKIVPVLKELVGADKKYKPMYVNFPSSVMEEADAVLYINALLHYWSYGTLLPAEEKEERLPLFDTTKVKVIGLGKEEDSQDIFINLCHSKTSLSKTDQEDLSYIFKNSKVNFPEDIPLKENIVVVGRLYLESDPNASVKK